MNFDFLEKGFLNHMYEYKETKTQFQIDWKIIWSNILKTIEYPLNLSLVKGSDCNGLTHLDIGMDKSYL